MHYYSDDGTIFMSKIQATEYGIKTGQKISFYYHDNEWDKCDWTSEPVNSLDYYYKEQAQRIRDTYDYVILCYSGGYDSTNILETFHFNNIKLDKIITVGALSQDSASGVDENHNGELYHNVFPYIKELGLESITEVYDYTTYFSNINNFSITQYTNEWADYTGGWYSPHNFFWRDLEKFVVPAGLENKKVAIIFGRDKPALFYGPSSKPQGSLGLNGFYFRDNSVNSYGNIKGTDNCDRINFYWDPLAPNILIKQLHIIKKVYDIDMRFSYDPEVGVMNISNTNTDKLVYNLRRPLVYKSPKSKTGIISLRDTYLKNKQNSDIYSFYLAGINRLNNKLKTHQLKPITSKFYKL